LRVFAIAAPILPLVARTETQGGDDPEVLAAGGVVVRDDGDGRRACVVHRPKYKDWSLPKGKLDPGESFEQAAVREVREETGFSCELGAPLGEVSYRDRKARPKLVRYWLMTPVEGEFAPNNEVDEVRWVDAGEAADLLNYERDSELVREALEHTG
jgi:8-oxo-dGTP diphosphatase